MPDDRGVVRAIYGCSRCAALTPDYCIAGVLDTGSQIDFHQRYWEEVDGDALQSELADLMGVVASLRRHLGSPAAGKHILEIGAGRGGLLRALRDTGYDAHGCEPAPNLVAIAREHYGLDADVLANINVKQMLQSGVGFNNYAAVFLWHVLEHLTNPIDVLGDIASLVQAGGVIVVQVPLLKSAYIYPEHYYFCSHYTFEFIAKRIGFGLADVVYDDSNLFATAVFRKGGESTSIAFFEGEITPDALSQIIILNERSKATYRSILNDQNTGLAAWEKLAKDRLIAMASMEQLIHNGLEAIATQAKMIDQRDMDTAALQQKVAELELAKIEAGITGS